MLLLSMILLLLAVYAKVDNLRQLWMNYLIYPFHHSKLSSSFCLDLFNLSVYLVLSATPLFPFMIRLISYACCHTVHKDLVYHLQIMNGYHLIQILHCQYLGKY